MTKFLGAIALILTMIAFIIFKGLVVADMWQWFLVPLGVKAITIAHAIGLSFLVGLMFTLGRVTVADLDKDNAGLLPTFIRTLTYFIAVAITWGCGAIVHFNFM